MNKRPNKKKAEAISRSADRIFLVNLLRYIAIFINIIYFVWVLFNGINQGFQGTTMQVVSAVGLMVILVLNTALLIVRVEH